MGSGNKAVVLIVIVLLPWLPGHLIPHDAAREDLPTKLKVGKQTRKFICLISRLLCEMHTREPENEARRLI